MSNLHAYLFDRVSVKGPDDCWLWQKAKNNSGYGWMFVGEKNWLAHRLSWILHNGEIPEGICVLHKCDVRTCVNPKHLFLGTRRDNNFDMIQKGRRRPDVRGSARSDAKLTEEKVLEIRASADKSSSLASRFNVTATLINTVRKRRAWAHI